MEHACTEVFVAVRRRDHGFHTNRTSSARRVVVMTTSIILLLVAIVALCCTPTYTTKFTLDETRVETASREDAGKNADGSDSTKYVHDPQGNPVINIIGSTFTGSNVNIALDRSSIHLSQENVPPPAMSTAVPTANPTAESQPSTAEAIPQTTPLPVKELSTVAESTSSVSVSSSSAKEPSTVAEATPSATSPSTASVQDKEASSHNSDAATQGAETVSSTHTNENAVVVGETPSVNLECECGPGWCGKFFLDPTGADNEVTDFVDVDRLKPQAAKTLQTIGFENYGAIKSVVGTESNFQHLAATFTGTLRILSAGDYKVCTRSDAGSRVTIDGNLAVAAPGLHAPEHTCATVALAIGDHAVGVDYFENGVEAGLVVSYSGPDTADKEYLLPSLWHDTQRCGPAPS